jgi:phosphohistidine phosphatase
VRLYLVRHGEAVSEDNAGSDRDRWLNVRGREAVRVLARLLREQGVAPDAIVSSPLPRAVQTAELLAQGLDYLGSLEVVRALEPSGAPTVAAREVAMRGTAVIVVGHEPSISSLAAIVIAQPAFPSFRTAQCCAFDNGKPVFSARSDLAQVVPLHKA